VASGLRASTAFLTALATLSLSVLSAGSVAAQPAVPVNSSAARGTTEGPAPPVAPAVVARDETGRATVRAIRLEAPLRLDGRLDEPLYTTIPPIDGFIQQEPLDGQPATEQTEVWIFYDAQNVYVAIRCWDSQPDRILANEMRRDNINIFYNDNVTVAFDTYHDRRSGFFFQTNALGAFRDGLVANEAPNFDWSTVWDVRSQIFEQGWTTEMSIPFKSLRYGEDAAQIWGVNVRRNLRWKNETTHITRIPASYGQGGVFRFSSAATLVGIGPPSGSRKVEVKPYGLSQFSTNREVTPPLLREFDGEFGSDLKYGLTNSLNLDFTYNTDFAQVEVDEQQVNLTRFSLLFPEKREFFLEGRGIFEFGGGGGNTPIVFFSRRIGLHNNRTVPIQGGGRLTGKAGKYTLGFLNLQTDDAELARAVSTNFSVVRVKRDILRRSSVGVLATSRTPTLAATGSNQAFGADVALNFFQDLSIDSYYARTRTPGRIGDPESYQAKISYAADRYGAEFERLKVGEAFNPEIGFLRRQNFRRDYGQLRFSPRPKSVPGVRKVSWEAGLDRFTSGAGVLESREGLGTFRVDFNSGDGANVSVASIYEFLAQPFQIAPGVLVPVGGYDTHEVRANYLFGPQRRISSSGALNFVRGSFYGGDRTVIGYNSRVELTSQLSVEPRLSINWVDLPEGQFTANVIGARTTYTISPRAFFGALVQYNSTINSLTTNLRFRWEYQPGSDLFVVYSEGRNTDASGPEAVANRALAIKLTRLFRF
jgi:hypothetical protein